MSKILPIPIVNMPNDLMLTLEVRNLMFFRQKDENNVAHSHMLVSDIEDKVGQRERQTKLEIFIVFIRIQ